MTTHSSIRDQIAITGIGESEYSEGGGNELEPLVVDACERAIVDAGLEPEDVDGVVTESNLMPDVFPAGNLDVLGIDREFSATTIGLGAGIVTSPLVAAHAIRSGLADHVLCYFGVTWASDTEGSTSFEDGPYSYHTSHTEKHNLEIPFGWVTQPVYMAALARRHMHQYGTTEDHLAEVAMQTRQNAISNEKAARQDPMTKADYLDSPMVADPYRVLDCCLISDGAAAFVMSGAEDAEGGPTDPVYVKGVGQGFANTNEFEWLTQAPEYPYPPADIAAEKAYDMAGVGPEDMDFAQIYDCFTGAVIIELEALGFADRGDGGEFIANKGITVENGALPVNTHGGFLSQAYVLIINHLVESVRQLRGTADNQVEDAELGLVSAWNNHEYGALVLGSDGR